MCAADKAMRVDREKTAAYYAGHVSMPCGCEVCRNYYRQIGEAYPALTGYLAKLGADALRPLELIWDDPHAGQSPIWAANTLCLAHARQTFRKRWRAFPSRYALRILTRGWTNRFLCWNSAQ